MYGAVMALPDRPNTAVLVIDVQNDVVVAGHDRDSIVANIAEVVDRARDADVPVVWIQHDDDDLPAETPGWEIVPELTPQPDEVIVRKNFRDSFQSTPLDAELAARDVGRLIVTGAQTDFCVRWTLHGAKDRGYDTVLVADAHTTDAESPDGMPSGSQLIVHTNSVWASQADTDCTTAVTPLADLTF